MRGGHNGVRHIALSPDESLVASSGRWDKTIKLWNVTTQRLEQTIDIDDGHIRAVQGIAWSPDGQSLVSGGINVLGGSLKLWSLDGTLLRKLDGVRVSSVAFSNDSKIIACGGFPNIVLWMLDYDIPTISKLSCGNGEGSTLVKFSPDSKYIAGMTDGWVMVWSIRARYHERNKVIFYEQVNASSVVPGIAFSNDSKYLAYACYGAIHVCEIEKRIFRTLPSDVFYMSIALNLGENTLLSCNKNREVTCIACAADDVPSQTRERIFALLCALKYNKGRHHRNVYQLCQNGGPLTVVRQMVSWWEIGEN